jgi:hypothetical protein
MYPAFLCALTSGAALMLAGCSQPMPDEIMGVCTRAVADKQYQRVLPYCTPALQAAYSNHLWLTSYHRTLATATEFACEPAEMTSATSAAVRCTMVLHTRDAGSLDVMLRADFCRRDKWYVEQVWRLRPDGSVIAAALPVTPHEWL